MDAFSQVLRDWQTFYVLMGTASATLIGLTFVAASLGSNLIPSQSNSEAVHLWVTPMISHFCAVLFSCVLMVVPTVTTITLSGLIGCGGLIGLLYVVQIGKRLLKQAQSAPLEVADLAWHLLIPFSGYVLMLLTAIGLWAGLSSAISLTLLGVGLVLLLAASIRNTWDLTVWIAQQRS